MSNIEFLVYEIKQDGDIARVGGIVNKGKISVGVTFSYVLDKFGEKTSVRLEVTDIVAYRRQITELPNGMSGELHVIGEGIGLIEKNYMLAN